MVQQITDHFWQAEARSEPGSSSRISSTLPAASSLPRRRPVLSWKDPAGILSAMPPRLRFRTSSGIAIGGRLPHNHSGINSGEAA